MKKSSIQIFLKKNWKTTLSGLISAIAAYWTIDYNLGDAPLTYKLAQWTVAIGLTTGGLAAKDADNN